MNRIIELCRLRQELANKIATGWGWELTEGFREELKTELSKKSCN